TSTTSTTLPATKCWDAGNKYITNVANQFKKFCKCAQGTYGYQDYTSIAGKKLAYRYLYTGNNTNWATSSTTINRPVYTVKCTNGNWYNTNQTYYYRP
ncbi:MAG: hypothetical protein NT129_06650, partial [Candidatus Aenigmarchaeota archaeon]|nr:hypothetical protein [Candidatus Aenigmarchaeota archaeon]